MSLLGGTWSPQLRCVFALPGNDEKQPGSWRYQSTGAGAAAAVPPLHGNLQLHVQQGGMKIPKARAKQRFPGDRGASELGNSFTLFLPLGSWRLHLSPGP